MPRALPHTLLAATLATIMTSHAAAMRDSPPSDRAEDPPSTDYSSLIAAMDPDEAAAVRAASARCREELGSATTMDRAVHDCVHRTFDPFWKDGYPVAPTAETFDLTVEQRLEVLRDLSCEDGGAGTPPKRVESWTWRPKEDCAQMFAEEARAAQPDSDSSALDAPARPNPTLVHGYLRRGADVVAPQWMTRVAARNLCLSHPACAAYTFDATEAADPPDFPTLTTLQRLRMGLDGHPRPEGGPHLDAPARRGNPEADDYPPAHLPEGLHGVPRAYHVHFKGHAAFLPHPDDPDAPVGVHEKEGWETWVVDHGPAGTGLWAEQAWVQAAEREAREASGAPPPLPAPSAFCAALAEAEPSIGPAGRRVEVLRGAPLVVAAVRGFASPAECDALRAKAGPETGASSGYARAGTVQDADGAGRAVVGTSPHRRARAAAVEPDWGAPRDVATRLAFRTAAAVRSVAGYDVRPFGQEPIAAIAYAGGSGDEYRRHCDGPCGGGRLEEGERVATSILYCEAPGPGGGGATTFTRAALRFAPRRGDLLVFGLRAGARTADDGLSEHSGCPVAEGHRKWIATQWHRTGVRHDLSWQRVAAARDEL
jgi:hypothetical protein